MAALCAIAAIVAAGCSSGNSSDRDETPTNDVPPAKTAVDKVVWALEAEPSSLDPIFTYNYYDNTILANLCEPLVRMNADLTTSDWLATSTMVDPLTWTYDLKPGITFWDGSAITPEDVVFSLKRNMDPELGSYFGSYFSRIKDVVETGPNQVTVKLTQPDALWNSSTIVTSGAFIISKRFAEAAGSDFGSAGKGIMCSGPFQFDSWTPGDSITMTAFDDYWNADVKPKVSTFIFRFLTESTAQANALTAGEADGMYVRDRGILPRLERSDGKVYVGDSLTYQFLIPSSRKGPLEDITVRKALSTALDRQAIADKVFDGAAEPLKTLVNEDAWGSDPDVIRVYQEAYDTYPSTEPDIEAAKKLVQQAGNPKDPIVLAYPTAGGDFQLKLATVVQDAGKKIGLTIELKPLSPSTAALLYQDPDAIARAGIDLFSVAYNVNNADPFGMYQTFDPGAGSVYNYSHFEDDTATKSLEEAAGTYDDVRRAELTVAAEKKVMASLPIIPIVSTGTVLYMDNSITGAPASFSQIWYPWAADVGGP